MMWLIMRGALGDDVEGAPPLLPRPRVQHRGRPHRARATAGLTGRRPLMRIALAGAGAFGDKHLDGLQNIDGVEIDLGRQPALEQAAEVADKYGAGHADTDLDEALARDDVDAVILCTPTQMHAAQAIAVHGCRQARAGRDPAGRQPGRRRGGRRGSSSETGLVCMVGPHPAVQPDATSTSTTRSSPASWRSSRWTCRPTSSAART